MDKNINTMEELDAVMYEGYTEDIDNMTRFLNVSHTKTRELLKHAPRIELSESLYHEYKQKFTGKVPRVYYNREKALKYLLSNNFIKVYYHDPRQSFTSKEVDKEIQVESNYLLTNMFITKILFNVSMNVIDIIIFENGYSPLVKEERNGELVNLYVNAENYKDKYDENLKTKDEIFSKSDYVKYTNMIKRGFYIRFQIGKGNNRYLHSVNQLKESEQKNFVTNWVKQANIK